MGQKILSMYYRYLHQPFFLINKVPRRSQDNSDVKEFQEVSSPTPHPNQGQLWDPGCSACSSVWSWKPHQWRLHSLYSNLLQCLAVLMVKLSPHVQFKPLNWVCDCKRLKDTYNISQNQPKYILLADLAFCKGLFFNLIYFYIYF